MVDELSVEAYHATDAKRAAQREIILDVVAQATHPSSKDIERLTGIQRTSVCGRLKELEDENLIRKGGRKIDPFTKRTVSWYEVVV